MVPILLVIVSLLLPLPTLSLNPLSLSLSLCLLNIPPSRISYPKSLLANTNLADRPLSRSYKASLDGFSAADFHELVDQTASALVLLASRGQM